MLQAKRAYKKKRHHSDSDSDDDDDDYHTFIVPTDVSVVRCGER